MSKVAWIPKQCDDFLTEKGVKSVGGYIADDNLSESKAETVVFNLNKLAQSAGKYIVIY